MEENASKKPETKKKRAVTTNANIEKNLKPALKSKKHRVDHGPGVALQEQVQEALAAAATTTAGATTTAPPEELICSACREKGHARRTSKKCKFCKPRSKKPKDPPSTGAQ